MTTLQQNNTVLLERDNERLFAVGRYAASAVVGTLTYVIRDENTGAIVFHVDVAGTHKRGMLSKLDVDVLKDSELVSRLVGQVQNGNN